MSVHGQPVPGFLKITLGAASGLFSVVVVIDGSFPWVSRPVSIRVRIFAGVDAEPHPARGGIRSAYGSTTASIACPFGFVAVPVRGRYASHRSGFDPAFGRRDDLPGTGAGVNDHEKDALIGSADGLCAPATASLAGVIGSSFRVGGRCAERDARVRAAGTAAASQSFRSAKRVPPPAAGSGSPVLPPLVVQVR